MLAEALKLPRKYLVRTVSPHLRPLSGENWEGYNFRTGKIEDMFMANVVDSVTVGKSVLIDSVSLGHLLIDIDVAVMR